MEKELKVAMIVAALLFSCATISSASAATYNITDTSYSNYFDSSGYITDASIVSGDVLNVKGNVNNKDMYIDRALSITSTSKTGKLYNGTISVTSTGSGTNITNLYFKNINHNAFDHAGTIVLDNANGCSITGNIIITTQTGDDSYGIHLVGASNNQITGNIITTTGDGEGAATANINGTITPGNGKYTSGVYLDGSCSNNVVSSNNIQTTGASAPVDWSAYPNPGIYPTVGLLVSTDSNNNIVNNNNINTDYGTIFGDYDSLIGARIAQSSANQFIDNIITTTGYSYAYGLEVVGSIGDTALNNFVSGNTIVTNAVRNDPLESYANGISVSGNTQGTLISGNNILAIAPTFGYGVIINDNNAILTGNIIGAIANVNYVVELFMGSNNVITNNVITGIGNFSTGVGTAYYSNNNNISNNTIITIGNPSATPPPYNPDAVPASNKGINLYFNSDNNTVQNNFILSSDEYAIDVTGSTGNNVTNNNLTSNAHIGNNAVAGSRTDNNISGNHWWFF